MYRVISVQWRRVTAIVKRRQQVCRLCGEALSFFPKVKTQAWRPVLKISDVDFSDAA
jgi:hypothetical protein